MNFVQLIATAPDLVKSDGRSSLTLDQECPMIRKSELRTISVLFIDGSQNQRTHWADLLKRCSHDYEIVEASDGQSGLELYRSRRFDCVLLELGLPDQSGFQILGELVPAASCPRI